MDLSKLEEAMRGLGAAAEIFRLEMISACSAVKDVERLEPRSLRLMQYCDRNLRALHDYYMINEKMSGRFDIEDAVASANQKLYKGEEYHETHYGFGSRERAIVRARELFEDEGVPTIISKQVCPTRYTVSNSVYSDTTWRVVGVIGLDEHIEALMHRFKFYFNVDNRLKVYKKYFDLLSNPYKDMEEVMSNMFFYAGTLQYKTKVEMKYAGDGGFLREDVVALILKKAKELYEQVYSVTVCHSSDGMASKSWGFDKNYRFGSEEDAVEFLRMDAFKKGAQRIYIKKMKLSLDEPQIDYEYRYDKGD